jgi:FkbM family methyltransferase
LKFEAYKVAAEEKLRALQNALSSRVPRVQVGVSSSHFDPLTYLVENARSSDTDQPTAPPAGAECKRFGAINCAFQSAPHGEDWIVDKLRASPHFPLKSVQLQLLSLKLARRDGVMIDIGANIGLTVIPPLLLGLVARAYAIEPSRRNHEILAWNIAANGLGDCAVIRRAALADKNGEAALSVTAASGLHHLQNRQAGDETAEELVPLTTLDKLISDENVADEVVFVKCDTQGAEALILAGASRTLARRKAIWELEFWPYGLGLMGSQLDDVISILEQSFSWFLDEKDAGKGLRPIADLRGAIAHLEGIRHTDLFLIP